MTLSNKKLHKHVCHNLYVCHNLFVCQLTHISLKKSSSLLPCSCTVFSVSQIACGRWPTKIQLKTVCKYHCLLVSLILTQV